VAAHGERQAVSSHQKRRHITRKAADISISIENHRRWRIISTMALVEMKMAKIKYRHAWQLSGSKRQPSA